MARRGTCCPNCGHLIDAHHGHFMQPKIGGGSTFRCWCDCVVDRDLNRLTERRDGLWEPAPEVVQFCSKGPAS